jgi:protein subunit release factor B
MPSFAVSEEKNKWLREIMETLRIREQDIEEKFVRSSGHGGQNVNKTATCVYIKHIPSGTEVKCMETRSQSINRFLARRELVKRLGNLSEQMTPEEVKREKTRKQKAKRKKRAISKYSEKDVMTLLEK